MYAILRQTATMAVYMRKNLPILFLNERPLPPPIIVSISNLISKTPSGSCMKEKGMGSMARQGRQSLYNGEAGSRGVTWYGRCQPSPGCRCWPGDARHGGNAIDAAVATVFALTVVEPMMVSIFGAGFVNFYDASTGNSVIVDNYTVAPTAATPDMYMPVSDTWPLYLETVGQKNRVGYLAVAVPGALKSWCYLEAGYGRLDLETVLQPAMRYAAQGSPPVSISSILFTAVSRIWRASRPAEHASCPMGAHRAQDKYWYAVTMRRRCSASLKKVLTRSTVAPSETWSCVISRPMVGFSPARIYRAIVSYAEKPCAAIIAAMRL